MNNTSTRPILCRLDDHALIRVKGDDAAIFLQGQLSNDVRAVSSHKSQLTSINTPRGRTLAVMQLFELDGTPTLSLAKELTPAVIAHLQRYILRAKVTIKPVNHDVSSYGMAGRTAATVLNEAGIAVPDGMHDATPFDGGVVVGVPGEHRYQLHGSTSTLQRLIDTLSSRCDTTDATAWLLSDTLVSLPRLGVNTSGQFLPQMLNLDTLGAVSFDKGCYAGQEIIARTHYRGQVKRRAALFFQPQAAQPGATIDTPAGAATVIQSVAHPENGYAILAVAKTHKDG